jgi:hypothetical protein
MKRRCTDECNNIQGGDGSIMAHIPARGHDPDHVFGKKVAIGWI